MAGKDLIAVCRLVWPGLSEGALLWLGDVDAAQGDGEICIIGIECPALVTVRFTLLKHTRLTAPMLETTKRNRASSGEWTMVESDESHWPRLAELLTE